MALYGLPSVRLDEMGKILGAVIQPIDGAIPAWIGVAYEYDAADIFQMIDAGDTVESIFIIDGHSVPGPPFKAVVYPDGTKGIELARGSPAWTVRELVQIV